MEPGDNSRGGEAGHFLSDCRLLRQCTQAPGPVCPVSTTQYSAVSRGALWTEVRGAWSSSLAFAYVHGS